MRHLISGIDCAIAGAAIVAAPATPSPVTLMKFSRFLLGSSLLVYGRGARWGLLEPVSRSVFFAGMICWESRYPPFPIVLAFVPRLEGQHGTFSSRFPDAKGPASF